MEGLGTLLIYAVLFYFLMRFGCGAHMIHGHAEHSEQGDAGSGKFIDPVCGKEVEQDKGYGVMFKGDLYRFCSRHCLDQFDGQPTLFVHSRKKEAQHEH